MVSYPCLKGLSKGSEVWALMMNRGPKLPTLRFRGPCFTESFFADACLSLSGTQSDSGLKSRKAQQEITR